MLNRRPLPHLRKPKHALLLRPPVGLPLFGGEFDPLVAIQSWRQILEHAVLCAAEHMVGSRCAHGTRRHAVGKMPRRHKLKDTHEIFGTIFHRRASESPTAIARERPHGLARVARAVFNALRLIDDDEIERKS